ncbi:MAG TPA: bifunctional diguanylate cyclase/phosphodiesterase [Candidatus Limnocylindrales bacterium]|nr:bifunctional diguanylate cyclase/phosphodiesterase [Candidatus Limnocylindrales bacterium]
MSKMKPRHPRRRDARALSRLAITSMLLAWLLGVGAVAVVAVVAVVVTEPGLVGIPLDAASAQAAAAILGAVAAVVTVLLLILGRRIRQGAGELAGELSELRAAYDRARLESVTDGLTGLGNHRGFQEELDARIAVARDEGSAVALLMLDVDDLKRTNERRGHTAGDETLRSVAMILRANARRGDRAFRIGGDEFAMLLPGTDLDAAVVQAKQILSTALSGNLGGVGEPVSLTIGVSAYPVPSAGRQPLAIHAEAALHSGKRHGRTIVERFDPGRHGIADDTRTLVELEGSVRQVAEGDLLRPVYQPIVSLATGEVVGFEGLVRLSPDAPFRNPASLFVAAEATRRTIEIDVVAATTVLAGATGLRPSDYLSVNLSPRTLEADAFSPLEIVALARRHGIAPAQLVVELTEREAVEDLERLRAAIGTLRRHGVQVAIDDVGAGNAGLRLMSAIDFDIMKIDLSLVRAAASDEPSEAVLRALGQMAQERGRRIVAEGIETTEQLEAVLELRYHAGQGYLLGRPAPTLVTDPVPLLDLVADVDQTVPAA